MADNTWNEYSRLVLKELETLGTGISSLNAELQEIKKEIALIKDREDRVEEIRVWKEKVSEILTPTQLKALIDEVADLKSFKTKAITIFAIIQFLMALFTVFGKYMHV